MADVFLASIPQVIAALDVLYRDPDPNAKEKANAWLSAFQKAITYDLDQLPATQRLPLRDSLLAALRTYASGPRVILTHISIALADLALQLSATEWADPTTSMIELFGKEPAMAGALLEFLQVLAEEYNSNFKLDIRSDFGQLGKGEKGLQKGTNEQATQVVALLSMYVQAPGITPALQNQCFACLGAWLRTGQAAATSVAGTAILAAAFSALSSDELFDNAVNVIVDLIHETQELDDNMSIIQELVPRLTSLKAALLDPATRADEDKMRGYCRVLVEAGEWYEPLITRHLASFLPLVEAIAECAAYDHLDVVGITLNFWYKLARGVRRVRDDPANRPLLDVFAALVGTIIRHLHYPADAAALAGQERDDFRNFRHAIGDTLKDCCGVLGAAACLRRSYDIVAATLAAPGDKPWQAIEAPLFSMRSMGAEVDPHDNEVMPLIMDLIPKLPAHPKIRYAAILVIGRYTEWIELHPEHIQFQLPYVSAGFDDADAEVSAAAAQTLKYLCRDCAPHLVPYLPQLHAFVQAVSPRLGAEDLLDLAAAIAHIIAAMPRVDAPQALATFCMPNVELVHALVSQPLASKLELRAVCDALERIDMFLAVVGRFEDGLPPSCAGTCEQVWGVLDALLAKYGGNALVAEKTCVAVRRGLQFFGEDAFKVAPAVLERLARSFEEAPASSYLWITAKMLGMFASRGDPAFLERLKGAFERETTKVFALLQGTAPAQLADILDDYVHLVADVTEYAPDLLFLSPAFPAAFQATLSTLSLLTPSIVLAALDTLRAIIGHESLLSQQPLQGSQSLRPTEASPAAFAHYAAAIRAVVTATSYQLVSMLLDGLVDGAGEDTASNVLTVLRVLSIQFPAELTAALPSAVEQLSDKMATASEKAEFLQRYNTAIAALNPNQVKDAFTWLLRTAKKSRERTRGIALDERR